MNANHEEATQVATEYLASLENLPHEARFILEEIRVRDLRTRELSEEIRKQTQSYFRHSSKNAGKVLPGKDAAIPNAVNELYANLEALAAEKIALSERLARILERAMARLQHDLQKMLILQGDEPGLAPTRHFLNNVESMVRQIESLGEAAKAIDSVPTVQPSPQDVPAPPAQKKRKIAPSVENVKLPSPVPDTTGDHSENVLTHKESGPSQPAHPRRSSRSRDFAIETPAVPHGGPAKGKKVEDTGNKDSVDGEDGAAEDDSLYCYCQKVSWGEMIGCDNKDCPYQWFHLKCANLKPPLPDTWYCDVCTQSLGLLERHTPATASGQGTRKGRKKR